MPVPEGIPIYDMRTDIPWHYEPRMKWAEMLERVAAADPDILKTLQVEDYPAPYPGARSILHWETYMVCSPTSCCCSRFAPACMLHVAARSYATCEGLFAVDLHGTTEESAFTMLESESVSS